MPKPNDTVTVSPGFSDEDGDVATSYEYQWLVNGVAIAGATKDHIVVEDNWRGQDLSVRVTGHTDPAISEPSEGTAISDAASVVGSEVTSLVANGASGAANVGFPKTGFVGAKFKIVLNNGNFFTTPYGEWTSNRSWVTVDRNGNVTFTGTPDSGTKTVTLHWEGTTAKADKVDYTFTVNTWWIPVIASQNGSQAIQYCVNSGGSPGAGEATGYFSLGAGVRNLASGLVWAEWGNLNTYGGGFPPQNPGAGSQYTVGSTTIGGKNVMRCTVDGGNCYNSNAGANSYSMCRHIL